MHNYCWRPSGALCCVSHCTRCYRGSQVFNWSYHLCSASSNSPLPWWFTLHCDNMGLHCITKYCPPGCNYTCMGIYITLLVWQSWAHEIPTIVHSQLVHGCYGFSHHSSSCVLTNTSSKKLHCCAFFRCLQPWEVRGLLDPASQLPVQLNKVNRCRIGFGHDWMHTL